MRYAACLLFVCLVGCGVPPPPAASTWDPPLNPDGDCKFIHNQGTLIIELPGRDHDLGAERGIMNAPRQLRDVQGDFAAQVFVDGPFVPTAGSTTANRASYNGAGLVLFVDNLTYARLERAALVKNGQYSSYLSWELRVNGQSAPTGWNEGLPLPNAGIYVRLERRGDLLLASESQDGQQWTNLPPLNLNMPARVKIGMAAISTSAAPFRPQFSDFRLTGG